jgi:hypothetical protein
MYLESLREQIEHGLQYAHMGFDAEDNNLTTILLAKAGDDLGQGTTAEVELLGSRGQKFGQFGNSRPEAFRILFGGLHGYLQELSHLEEESDIVHQALVVRDQPNQLFLDVHNEHAATLTVEKSRVGHRQGSWGVVSNASGLA